MVVVRGIEADVVSIFRVELRSVRKVGHEEVEESWTEDRTLGYTRVCVEILAGGELISAAGLTTLQPACQPSLDVGRERGGKEFFEEECVIDCIECF